MAIVVVALARICAARGLKTQKSPGAFEALSKLRAAHEDLEELESPETAAPSPKKAKLQAENDALTHRKRQLEGLVQMTRAKVQKAKVVAEKQAQIPGGNPEVLKQEIEDLKNKLKAEENDKRSLVQTLRQMLAKGTTKAFQKHAESDQEKYMNLARKCGEDRHDLQAQGKEAEEKFDEMKELSQSLQGQNMDLQKELAEARAELGKAMSKTKELSMDKANLLATMHSMVRENTKAKAALHKEEDVVKKEAEELRNDTAMIANLTHKATKPRPAVAKNATKKTKLTTRKLPKVPVTLAHHKREESMAAQMAHMRDINRYIDSVYTARVESDDVSDKNTPLATSSGGMDWQNVGAQVDILQKREDVFDQGENAASSQAPVSAGGSAEQSHDLKDWLGLHSQLPKDVPKDKDGLSPIDALEPEAVKQKQQIAVQQEKADADDGGDGIQGPTCRLSKP